MKLLDEKPDMAEVERIMSTLPQDLPHAIRSDTAIIRYWDAKRKADQDGGDGAVSIGEIFRDIIPKISEADEEAEDEAERKREEEAARVRRLAEPTLENFKRLTNAAGFSREVAGNDYEILFNAWRAAETASPKKGLLIIGGFGCGKTHFVRAIYAGSGWMVFNCGVRGDVADMREFDFKAGRVKVLRVVLDDVGADVPVSDWGVKINPVQEFIMSLYDSFEVEKYHGRSGRVRLAITTNLKPAALAEHLGGRVWSRVTEFCHPVEMTGGSKRK